MEKAVNNVIFLFALEIHYALTQYNHYLKYSSEANKLAAESIN